MFAGPTAGSDVRSFAVTRRARIVEPTLSIDQGRDAQSAPPAEATCNHGNEAQAVPGQRPQGSA